MPQSTNIGFFLLNALYQRGVRHIFGIPGDFALNFFKAIEQFKKIELITLSHEPALGFAADGLSRATSKIGAVAVTYGAGALNIVNSIACAYAEKSPLVLISGAPGMHERGTGILLHHQAKTLQSQRNIFKEITSYQAILEDPRLAPQEIENALQTAEKLASPVYIEIPRDQVFQKMPCHSISRTPLAIDRDASFEASLEIMQKIHAAKRPLLMAGVEIHRFGLSKSLVKLADRLKIPVVTSFMGRGVFPCRHPLYAGIYLGPAGDPKTMRLVENSDCLVLLGVLLTDTNMGLRLHSLNPHHLIQAIHRQVIVGRHLYNSVPLKNLVEELLKIHSLPRKQKKFHRHLASTANSDNFFDSSPLDVEDVIAGLNSLFHKKGPMPTIADNGDCLFASLKLQTDHLLASGYYATMGFAVPAGMGAQIGTGKRPIILVGDGAFQMTGAELSHCPRLKLNPIVIVFNNGRWEMLRTIQPIDDFFDLTPWNFSGLAQLWKGRGWRVTTRREYWNALQAAYHERCFCLIDAVLPLGNVSKTLRSYLHRIRK